LNDQYFPKIIWLLWLQGYDQAPLVVRKCYESWLKHNPGWEIIFLDETNLSKYIALKPRHTTDQALSDILRINLLAQYGGIWIDATCFCTKPLDEWLHEFMISGFFAFDRPAPDRMLSSWFLASYTDNYIVQAYQKAVEAYWDKNPGIRFFENSRWRFLKTYLKGTQVWFDSVVTRILKVYPYFWFHYLFESIYLKDKRVKQLWDITPKLSADMPHKLQFAGLFNMLNEEIKTEIDSKLSPVYKLTWKYDPSEYREGTILDYLLNS
jgi:hypothetical protein